RPVSRNLSTVLLEAAQNEPSHGITYEAPDGTELHQSYGELLNEAAAILGGLRARGLTPGDHVLLQIPDNRDLIPAFWGCVLGGVVPVPLGVPPSYHEPGSGVSKVLHAWQMLRKPLIVTGGELAHETEHLKLTMNQLEIRTARIEDLPRAQPNSSWHDSSPSDVALMLLTSGSTGQPKGVLLTHHNVIAYSAGAAQMNRFTRNERSLNWFPLDHVGAIVMCHI